MGQRNVVGRVARSLRFLTCAVFTMNDRRLFRMEREVQLELLIDGLQSLIRSLPLNFPVTVPDAGGWCAHAGDSRAGAIDSFRVIKLLVIQIAKPQMRQVNVLHIPSCSLSRITADGLTKKSQFESVMVAVCRFQISGVVPPLRLKIGMIEIISWEFE